jgi:hypothetical protein
MLSARVARLDRNAPREAPCRECGGPPPPGSYRLELDRSGERRDGPERCPACGRQLVFRLEFDRQG